MLMSVTCFNHAATYVLKRRLVMSVAVMLVSSFTPITEPVMVSLVIMQVPNLFSSQLCKN